MSGMERGENWSKIIIYVYLGRRVSKLALILEGETKLISFWFQGVNYNPVLCH